MAKPTSKVLVINDEPLILRELLKGLNAAARSLENPFGIAFVGALTAKEGLALIERSPLNELATWRRLTALSTYRPRLPRGRAPSERPPAGGGVGIMS